MQEGISNVAWGTDWVLAPIHSPCNIAYSCLHVPSTHRFFELAIILVLNLQSIFNTVEVGEQGIPLLHGGAYGGGGDLCTLRGK